MHTYAVGEMYHPSRKFWTQGFQFKFRGGELELAAFLDRPSRHDVNAFRVGPCEFALYAEGSQVILCHAFHPPKGSESGLPWSGSPYAWHLVEAEERVPPPDPARLSPETRALLHLVLVEAIGGKVIALRSVTLSAEFTQALYGAIARQVSRPWSSEAYDRELADVYRRHPSIEALVESSVVRCNGGD